MYFGPVRKFHIESAENPLILNESFATYSNDDRQMSAAAAELEIRVWKNFWKRRLSIEADSVAETASRIRFQCSLKSRVFEKQSPSHSFEA